MTGFYAVWPFFVLIALLLCLVATPLFRWADTPPSTHAHRLKSLDGFRGFLALAVVFHHDAIYHRYLGEGLWSPPASSFYERIGPIGVGFFFMITGFLFWSQLLRREGRPSWVALYTGRIFRIGPLYVFAVICLFGIIAVQSGFQIRVPVAELSKEIVEWLSLGLWTGLPLNGFGFASQRLAGVTWTLQWEWWFYLSLPVLALFARRRGWHLRFLLVIFVLVQAYLHLVRGGPYKGYLAYVMLFLIGMLVGSLCAGSVASVEKTWRLPDKVSSSLVIVLLIVICQFKAPTVTSLSQVMMGAVMYLVVTGTSVFGLLTSRAAVRLGDVSYGLYLLQGLVLGAVLKLPVDTRWDVSSPFGHWVLCFVCIVSLACLATVTHVWIERPGIGLGRRLLRKSTERRAA